MSAVTESARGPRIAQHKAINNDNVKCSACDSREKDVGIKGQPVEGWSSRDGHARYAILLIVNQLNKILEAMVSLTRLHNLLRDETDSFQ